jgi:hypothetical protein
MTLSSLQSLILHAVQDVSSDRLQRAVCGLADGTLTVTLTRQSDHDLRALVQNGTGSEYGVTLTDTLTACSCGMLTWPEACPSCVTAYQQPKTAIAA